MGVYSEPSVSRSVATPRDDTTAPLERAATRPLGVVLRVRGASASSTTWQLGEGVCVIGAGKEADLIIDDAAVSRRHVELTLVAEGVLVRDLGSRNGTFYHGQRLAEAVLAPGATLRIGKAEVVIEPDLTTLDVPASSSFGYRGLIGASEGMRALFAKLARLEGSLVSVLIEGESGVGKELVAEAIHAGSEAASGPLVIMNCGALPTHLVLSELFGHVKGAFTGAFEDRMGAFEAAEGGTLFLDEVGELPLDVQPALLRALDTGEVKRVGEDRPRRVRLRVIAATHRNLRELIATGAFRDDLYYRLAVVRLSVPPLRERTEDIAVLAQHFARAAGSPELTPELVNVLKERPWPGNVRELRNAVLCYAAIGSLPSDPAPRAGLIDVAIAQAVDPTRPYQEQKEHFNAIFSHAYFQRVLTETGGNQTEAAAIARVDRSYLSKLLSRYRVKR